MPLKVTVVNDAYEGAQGYVAKNPGSREAFGADFLENISGSKSSCAGPSTSNDLSRTNEYATRLVYFALSIVVSFLNVCFT